MDRSLIREQMPALVAPHVPRNARSFTFNVYDSTPQQSILGVALDPAPFEGKAVVITDELIIVKLKRTQFAVLDRNLVATVPGEGDKVLVTPYARRHFDGQRVGTPREHTEHMADGTPYTVKSVVLGEATSKLPVPAPQCPELADLVEQLEVLPAPDGHRRIAHLLVDAGARDFSIVDPEPHNIIATPPAISFTVTTEKFAGQVTISYDRGGDVYVINLRRDGALIKSVDEVYFDDLGQTLDDLIDDRSWRHIGIDVLGRPRRSLH